jgi:hypothetical protein
VVVGDRAAYRQASHDAVSRCAEPLQLSMTRCREIDMRLCTGDAVGGSAISVLKADSKESDSQISGNLRFRNFSGGWCNGVRRLHIRVQIFGVGYITSVVLLGYIVTLSNDSSILGLGGYIPRYGLPGILIRGVSPVGNPQSIQSVCL